MTQPQANYYSSAPHPHGYPWPPVVSPVRYPLLPLIPISSNSWESNQIFPQGTRSKNKMSRVKKGVEQQWGASQKNSPKPFTFQGLGPGPQANPFNDFNRPFQQGFGQAPQIQWGQAVQPHQVPGQGQSQTEIQRRFPLGVPQGPTGGALRPPPFPSPYPGDWRQGVQNRFPFAATPGPHWGGPGPGQFIGNDQQQRPWPNVGNAGAVTPPTAIGSSNSYYFQWGRPYELFGGQEQERPFQLQNSVRIFLGISKYDIVWI